MQSNGQPFKPGAQEIQPSQFSLFFTAGLQNSSEFGNTADHLSMKSTTRLILSSIVAACTALLISCASTQTTTQNRESMLVASGFKVITPKTAAQKQKLLNLPAGKVTMIKKGKKTYYVFPDPAHNQAYVGGPKEYHAYQQLRSDKKLAREDLQDAEMYQDATMEWSLWEGGEGVWGPMGGPAPF
jgi:hypothetical protein